MDRKLLAFLLILIVLVLSSVGTVFGQAQALPGVTVGDTFTYESSVIWTSKNSADVAPSYLALQNGTTLQVTVQTVTGSTVQLEKTLILKNGTTQVETELDEVNSGITGTVLLYAANLSAGGLLFPGSTELPYTINDTTIRAYVDSYRETNHINANNSGAEGSGVSYSIMDLYFDKQTGVCVEYFLTTVYTATPNQEFTQHLQLKAANLWRVSDEPIASPTGNPTSNPTASMSPTGSAPPTQEPAPIDPLYIIIIVLVAVIAVFAVLLLRKGKPKQKEMPSTAKTPA